MLTSIIAQYRKPIPENKKRNDLIVQLKESGLTYKEISLHPQVIKLSNNQILTLSRVAQIYRKRKGGDKDGKQNLHTR